MRYMDLQIHPPASVQGVASVSLVSSPDHTHIMGMDQVIFRGGWKRLIMHCVSAG